MMRTWPKRGLKSKKFQSKKFPTYCTGYYRSTASESLECPRCGDILPKGHHGALSWDGKTEICPTCGHLENQEAMTEGLKSYDPYRIGTLR